VFVSIEAIGRLLSGAGAPAVHWYLFAVLAVALLLDFSRMSASLSAARQFESPALRSNAFHFGADMAGTLAVLVGLVSVRAGFQQGDAIAALLVAAIIFLAAGRLIGENANVLMDRTPSEAREAAERAIAELGEDIELSRLRLRESAGRYFADVVVSVPPGRAVVEGHQAADLIEAAVERTLPGSDVVVHVEPRRSGLDLRDRVLAIALAEPLVREAHDVTIFEQGGASSVSLHLKFPPELDLSEAHEIAERVERAIRARPEVADVQTHLEPLERTLTARPPDERADAIAAKEIERVLRERIGAQPQKVRLLSTEAGRVVFVTLAMAPGQTLAEAHTLTGELEEELRQRVPEIADVVIHTEPSQDGAPRPAGEGPQRAPVQGK
jgi:divalent metal cation (Fe/Co/Zn/Cd) transporter